MKDALWYLLPGIPVVLGYLGIYIGSSWFGITVRSCNCGAHWWVRRWYFIWRHMEASPFNDRLQNRWTIWLFEFRKVLKLSASELLEMGYAGSALWKRSRWQRSPSPGSYCVRCARRSW